MTQPNILEATEHEHCLGFVQQIPIKPQCQNEWFAPSIEEPENSCSFVAQNKNG